MLLQVKSSVPTLSEIVTHIEWWNMTFPIDRWWREKHKVAYNSPRHRDQDFISMKMEYEEDLMYVQLRNRSEKDSEYKPGYGNWLKKRKPIKMSEEEIDDLFDSFDPSNVQLNDNGSITL